MSDLIGKLSVGQKADSPFDPLEAETVSNLLSAILEGYKLDPEGIHGLPHWIRVRTIGLRLAGQTGADPLVVNLFSIFHDSRRINNGLDSGHGVRGAALARELQGKVLHIPDNQLDLLCRACETHTGGDPRTEADPTILTCWDADRLDLGRIGLVPDPNRLGTAPAKTQEIIDWAHSLEKSTSHLAARFLYALGSKFRRP